MKIAVLYQVLNQQVHEAQVPVPVVQVVLVQVPVCGIGVPVPMPVLSIFSAMATRECDTK